MILFKRYLMLIVVVLATFLRLFQLESVPPSPSLDEVTIGWNAYSLLITGKDEYGSRLPLILRAYDDWRPALYVYLVVPFIKLFGLQTISVRFPSVLLSIGVVLLTYGIVRNIFITSVTSGDRKKSEHVGLLAMLLTAISPWHIYLSRLGHEANLGVFLFTLGIYYLVRFFQSGSLGESVVAIISFIGSMYSYQSEKVLVPMLFIFSGLIYWREWKALGNKLFVPIFIAIVLVIPVIFLTFTDSGLIRFTSTSAFTTDNPVYQESTLKYLEAKRSGNLLDKIIYSYRMTSLKIFLVNYISHFSPTWLFTGGLHEAHKIPGLGLLYIWELPFLLSGIVFFAKLRNKKITLFIFTIIFIAPMAGAITTQAPHAMRSYTFIPTIQIITAYGIYHFLLLLKSTKVNYVFLTILSVVMLQGLYEIKNQYFDVFPRIQSDSFGYALGNALKYVNNTQRNYKTIVLSNTNAMYQSYMFFLFYSRFDPTIYLSYGGSGSGGFAQTHEFDKFQFRPILWENEQSGEDILYITNISEIGENVNILKSFANLDGTEMIVAARKVE